jgi:protein TonB
MQLLELPEPLSPPVPEDPPQQAYAGEPQQAPMQPVLSQPVIPPKQPSHETKQRLKREPVRPAQSQSKPASEAPDSFTGNASLPEAKLPATDDAGLSVPAQGASEGHANISQGNSGGSVTPPGFGGAAYLNNPKPEYPVQAKRMGIEGKVLLNVLVSREGRTLKLEIAKSSGSDLLDNAAAEAVRKWKFMPAHRGNTVLEQWVMVPLTFRIKN